MGKSGPLPSPPHLLTWPRKPKPPEVEAASQARISRAADSEARRVQADTPTTLPPAPDNFEMIAAQAWDRFGSVLVESRVLTTLDLSALEELCLVYEEVQELRDDIRDGGRVFVVERREGGEVERQRPQVRMLENAQKRLVALMDHFGLTPKSRERVRMHSVPEKGEPEKDKEEKGDPAEEYFG
jgi:P27 family predicted phage terminase small subunit